ncbi:MAG: hypothetical protein M1823_005317 [Watsoniomyces obsoletus]|nr:MAG: hypothetical protein M1823_005317 [Watsoniomyces obsoletus]
MQEHEQQRKDQHQHQHQRTISWESSKGGSWKGLGRFWGLAEKLTSPTTSRKPSLSQPRLESYWPTTLDRESHKAARILRSYCRDGFQDEELRATPEGPQLKRKALKRVPSSVIARAHGVALFSVMRSGQWISGGSGVLLARRLDDSWSAPSAILLHSAALDFLIGVDIYDGLVVANTPAALAALQSSRYTLGADMMATPGPLVDEESDSTEFGESPTAPLWTYIKSRGYYFNMPLDGLLITERVDENERFYGERIGVAEVLSRKAKHSPREMRVLLETIKIARGDPDRDESLLPTEPSPGDLKYERPDHVFGIPDDDEDPFGVRALEMEGFQVLEAGSRSRPASEQFQFAPAPTSPVYHTFQHRRSASSLSARAREGYSRRSMDRSTQTVDMSTQTTEDAMGDLTEVEDEPNHGGLSNGHLPKRRTGVDDEADSNHEEEPVADIVVTVQAQVAPQVLSKARLVTIPRRVPPALPPRNPGRRKMAVHSEPLPSRPLKHRGSGDGLPSSPIIANHKGWTESSAATSEMVPDEDILLTASPDPIEHEPTNGILDTPVEKPVEKPVENLQPAQPVLPAEAIEGEPGEAITQPPDATPMHKEIPTSVNGTIEPDTDRAPDKETSTMNGTIPLDNKDPPHDSSGISIEPATLTTAHRNSSATLVGEGERRLSLEDADSVDVCS